ncbi:DUF2628 domain-containing protein [Aquabacter spiritensis]|uniref:Uncharacterized protein DUF2628 n=1 Tax=Aquabacter spiritensis TaxID=933073 RepID=A0A4R3LNN5_9HYPH|nr:DUF2628 domain-containing protein [Aquabacter spiritensis]TCT02073.1 uncharacterized protein DUF2628 [Aquabacter spiritensis]
MAIWNVFIKPTVTDRGGNAVFVREGLSFAALLFAPLALLRFRLWLALLAYALIAGASEAAARLIGMPALLEFAITAGLHLIVALELPALRAWKLRRIGYREAGAVVARDRDAAERRFFARDLDAAAPPQRPTPLQAAPRPAGRPGGGQVGVIGSFMEPRPS